jgi:hypothetical protein
MVSFHSEMALPQDGRSDDPTGCPRQAATRHNRFITAMADVMRIASFRRQARIAKVLIVWGETEIEFEGITGPLVRGR